MNHRNPEIQTPPPLEKLVSIREFADVLGCSVRTVERLIEAGEAPSIVRYAPRRVGFLQSDVRSWIEARRVHSPGQPAVAAA